MVFTIDDQGLEHRARVIEVDLVTQILGGTVGDGRRVLHTHQHAGRGALEGCHCGIGLGHLLHIGAVAQPGVVARHQLAVPSEVHVQLQHVGTGIGSLFIGHACLFWIQAGVATVRNHLGWFSVQRQVFGNDFQRGAVIPTATACAECQGQ